MDEVELARQRGRPLLAGLAGRVPAAEARAEVAAQAARAIVDALDLEREDGDLTVEAARLQEIGKLYVATDLLAVPLRELTASQRSTLEEHFEQGRAVALGAGVPKRVCNWILHSRERWDGSGPRGLIAEEIPLPSRIIAITREYLDAPLLADTVSEETAQAVGVSHVRQEAGAALDPELAELASVLADPAGPRDSP